MVIVFGAVFLIHLAVLIRRSSGVILAAISLMIGLYATNILYMSLGWIALPTRVGQLVGLGLFPQKRTLERVSMNVRF